VKKVEAVIRVEKLDAVKAVLDTLDCPGLMLTRIEGHGKQKGLVQQFRGREYKVNLLPKYKLEVVVTDEMAKPIAEAIIEAARTGEVGDGKIFIYPVEEVCRIRTGECGEGAI
jgi:nitrogen regulatory protein P-II 1